MKCELSFEDQDLLLRALRTFLARSDNRDHHIVLRDRVRTVKLIELVEAWS